ncbi:twin-arginine translocation signal domain-containing protein [Haloarcula onubensis]|uniref:Twin-arginine translocation signal domain-containing protein n=1 Tax=Haloarcula onubensis TaxID=2950539 RepID=A0ABU2FUQ8_9EURY|nr:twin-arginine translocation signal domain-containing protein [Halomicroarcula sp. S3CR25-11]MDS0283976.1 twin-arginine translocation signal domain-containing protein [Halomicroarcula sp. S3CR25-11]
MISRRDFLKGSCAVTVLIAGCQSDSNRSSETDITPTGEFAEVSEVPQCGDIDGTHVLLATPEGFSVTARTEEAAESFVEEEINPENNNILIVEATDRYVIEFRNEVVSEDLRLLIDQYDNITGYFQGLSRPTLNEVGTQIQSSLAEAETVSEYGIQYVSTEESSPDLIAASITVAEGEDLVTSPSDITYYVETDDGEETVAGGSEIEIIRSEEFENRPDRLTIEFSESAQNRFQELANQGAISAGPPGNLRMELNNETIFEGFVSSELLESMRSGSWEGRLVLPIRDSQTLSQFQSAVGLVNTSVPVNTDIENCES